MVYTHHRHLLLLLSREVYTDLPSHVGQKLNAQRAQQQHIVISTPHGWVVSRDRAKFGWPRAAHGPTYKIPLHRGCVPRPVEYTCQIKFRRRRPSGLGALGFRKCCHRTDGGRPFDRFYRLCHLVDHLTTTWMTNGCVAWRCLAPLCDVRVRHLSLFHGLEPASSLRLVLWTVDHTSSTTSRYMPFLSHSATLCLQQNVMFIKITFSTLVFVFQFYQEVCARVLDEVTFSCLSQSKNDPLLLRFRSRVIIKSKLACFDDSGVYEVVCMNVGITRFIAES